jgi:hypothetical protein
MATRNGVSVPTQGVIVSDEAIGREIRQLRQDLKEDLGDIKTELGKLLPREVYSANHDALKRRMDVLERDVERQEAERTNTRRWLITAIVVPTVSLAVSIILAVT